MVNAWVLYKIKFNQKLPLLQFQVSMAQSLHQRKLTQEQFIYELLIPCVHTSLIISKTKVAPIKRISILRLKLCGALIIVSSPNSCYDYPQDITVRYIAWTVSTIVLSWLQGNSKQCQVFVGNCLFNH